MRDPVLARRRQLQAHVHRLEGVPDALRPLFTDEATIAIHQVGIERIVRALCRVYPHVCNGIDPVPRGILPHYHRILWLPPQGTGSGRGVGPGLPRTATIATAATTATAATAATPTTAAIAAVITGSKDPAVGYHPAPGRGYGAVHCVGGVVKSASLAAINHIEARVVIPRAGNRQPCPNRAGGTDLAPTPHRRGIAAAAAPHRHPIPRILKQPLRAAGGPVAATGAARTARRQEQGHLHPTTGGTPARR